jgi:alanyl-tRNA synthetase
MEHHGEVSGSAEKNLLFKHDPLESVKKQYKRTEFTGYSKTSHTNVKVLAILADGKLADTVSGDGTYSVILDKTPFYAEKGGQVGDKGSIGIPGSELVPDKIFDIETTQLDGELVVHVGHCVSNTLRVGDKLFAYVDTVNRQAISRAHSATHLLHLVLRKELGGHAEQQGSKVSADELRFDFTNHSAIDKETLKKIELQVNELILEATDGDIQEMGIEEARKTGAMMLFGEKYPEKVRVVKFGESIELCGGTHLTNTSQIGYFKILSEESVSAGIRRITALTGLEAVKKALHDSSLLQQTAAVLKIPAEDIVQKVEDLTAQVKKLQKQIKSVGAQNKVSADELIKEAVSINGANGTVKLIAKRLDGDVNTLRQLIDQIRQKEQNVAVLLGSVQDGKVLLIAGLSRDLTAKKFDAVEWIKSLAPLIGGNGGGGRPDMAQGGGNNVTKLPEALDAAKGYLGG